MRVPAGEVVRCVGLLLLFANLSCGPAEREPPAVPTGTANTARSSKSDSAKRPQPATRAPRQASGGGWPVLGQKQAAPAPASPTPTQSPVPEEQEAAPPFAEHGRWFGPEGVEGAEALQQQRVIERHTDAPEFAALSEPLLFVPERTSIDQLVRQLPCPDWRDDFRKALRREDSSFTLATASFDDDESDERPARWQIVWASMMMCNAVFLFDERGVLRDRLTFESRGNLAIGEIVQRDGEGAFPELRFEEVVGTSICCYPVVHHFYRLSAAGRFVRVFSHARSHDTVGKGVVHDYWYQFVFDGPELRVTQVLSEASPLSPEIYRYSAGADRFVATPETKARLAREAAAARQRARELELEQ